MTIKSILQETAFRFLPRPLLTHILHVHYLRALRRSLYHEEDMHIVESFIRPGDCAIDVGANIGTYTILFSRLVGPNGQVHSYEPIPLTFGVLKNNVAKLGSGNCFLYNSAVSDDDKPSLMEIPRYQGGGWSLYRARVKAGDSKEPVMLVQVEMRSLDRHLDDLAGRVAFLKIDVEGHELNVIRGAQNLIQKHRPGLLIELSDDPDSTGSSASEICGRLESLGYACYRLDNGHLKRRRKGDTSINYFFLTDQQLVLCRMNGFIPQDSLL